MPKASRPDLTRHPRFTEATVLETVLEPGQMLLIPVGWWHWAQALDVSATVTFHHFQIPGQNHRMATPPAAGLDQPLVRIGDHAPGDSEVGGEHAGRRQPPADGEPPAGDGLPELGREPVGPAAGRGVGDVEVQ